jgi:D-arabinose 1-dehydrogenase-like Zn-dependent alcohol dehydrogenase
MTHSSTMLAAVFKPGDINLEMQSKRLIPKPGKGQVLLKVSACGGQSPSVQFIDAF